MTDVKTLIFRAQAGDEQAFADLLRAHYAFVYAIVMGIVGNPEDAEEVVQDVFVNVYSGLSRYEERTKFKPWLAKIARNRALNWIRDQKSENVSINDVREHKLQTPDALAEQLIIAEHKELIRGALGTLSPKDRKIARSYYLDGASYDELIRTHGLSYKAISVRLSRAKRKLAKRLRHLRTGVFVSPSMTFKQIGTGGLTVMKIGTVPKITVGAAAIIGLGLIGTHHFILSKEDSSPSVEIVTPTLAPQTNFTRKRTVTAPQPENKPQISAEEMQRIENFFAQLEEAHALNLNVEIDEEASPPETVNSESLETSEIEVVSEPHEKRFFGLTLSEIEAQIPVLEEEIRTNLTEAVELYTDLTNTDGTRPFTPELAEWRDETWAEVKRLFNETANEKIPRYVSYLRIVGEDNPLRDGGWLSELMDPLPMGVSYEGSSP